MEASGQGVEITEEFCPAEMDEETHQNVVKQQLDVEKLMDVVMLLDAGMRRDVEILKDVGNQMDEETFDLIAWLDIKHEMLHYVVEHIYMPDELPAVG